MIILLDVDGVVADLNNPWLARYNKDYNDDLTLEDITAWNIAQYTKPECGLKMYDYLEDPTLYDDVKPIEGAIEGVRALRDMGHEVAFVTSCSGPEMCKAKTAWIIDHDGLTPADEDPMDYIYLVKRKHRIEGDLLLDDYERNLENFKGWQVLFDQPWNRHVSDIKRVTGWSQFLTAIDRPFFTVAAS